MISLICRTQRAKTKRVLSDDKPVVNVTKRVNKQCVKYYKEIKVGLDIV